jgi:hypothetical protein
MQTTYRENVISFCSRANRVMPRFYVLNDEGCQVATGDLDGIWHDALPLIERACSAARFSVRDAWESVGQGAIVPVGLVNDAGDFTTISLVYQAELPGVGPVLAGVAAPDGPWDFRFPRIVDAMADMASSMEVEGLALISPDLIPVSWEKFEYPGGECMLYRFDNPPREETVLEVLGKMWRG